ncbi:MAG: isoleucine--tRNA ligase, partial [Desulfobacterales bacterium]
ALAARWERLLGVRSEVLKALETARAQKLIGHPLDAALVISAADDQLYQALQPYAEILKSLAIVSAASLVKGEPPAGAYTSEEIVGLGVQIEPAAGDKCERCWVHEPSVGENAEQPTICRRCQDALTAMSLEG